MRRTHQLLLPCLAWASLSCGAEPAEVSPTNETPSEMPAEPTQPNASGFSELEEELAQVLRDATSLDLFTINPGQAISDTIGGEPPPSGPRFHGYVILGQRTTTAPADAQAVVEALATGDRENDEMAAMCFNPRHGIRARSHDKLVELLICFECLQVQVFLDGTRSGGFLISETPAVTLDRVYAALAP